MRVCTTSPKRLLESRGCFGPVHQNQCWGLSGSGLTSMPRGSLNSCSLALIPSPLPQQSLLVQNAAFEPFCIISNLKPKHLSRARQSSFWSTEADRREWEVSSCVQVASPENTCLSNHSQNLLHHRLDCFSHPLSHNFILSYVQLKVL